VVNAVLGGAVFAACFAYLIIRYPFAHFRLSQDLPNAGPQKFHLQPTPRIGGIAVFLGIDATAFLLWIENSPTLDLILGLMICGLVAFGGGLAEDFTKRVKVRMRLLLTFMSATLGFFFLDARITELALPGFDWVLQFTLFSFAFTLFAVGGFAQAMNIIDGFNGLAGITSLIVLAAIAYTARTVSDENLMWAALSLGAAILGFLIFNFPRGSLFLGDGGAYLIGFLIAELAVLLVHRNSEVSPWFALTVLAYPIVETVFSMYRKRMLRQQSAGDPDGLHLHMLIHKRLVRRYRSTSRPDFWANPLTSPFLWVLAASVAVPAALYWNQTPVLQGFMVAFAGLYLWLYWAIVQFRTPWPLAIRRTAGQSAMDSVSSPDDGAVGASNDA
jgi:UDP-N-acetylmuramyl pentapeptide phosphotransferase/UDP-N-acetylglucosamine-1-phosphate transferase